jgi:hypothetical protein
MLTLTSGGNLAAGYLSYERVALWLLETRIGVELPWPKPFRLAVGGGAGRPFTTETSTVTLSSRSENLWFFEGFARASLPIRWSGRWRIDVGAEVALLSRPVRLQVDEVVAYDFGWQPGLFLETAFEFR